MDCHTFPPETVVRACYSNVVAVIGLMPVGVVCRERLGV
jgi:hypothetical protein